jgi:hypothetical protein
MVWFIVPISNRDADNFCLDLLVFDQLILSHSFLFPSFPFSFPSDKENMKTKTIQMFSRPFIPTGKHGVNLSKLHFGI